MTLVAHGIDAVDIKRFSKLIEKGERDFLKRCFSEKEIDEASDHKSHQRLAGWFAVKESVLKAIGTGQSNGATFTDIEVSHCEFGAPQVVLSGNTKKLAENLGISTWLVSISHIDKIAIASVIGTTGSGSNESIKVISQFP